VTNEHLFNICERSSQKLASKCNYIIDKKSLKIRIH